jgi:hypothetical protein
MEIYIDCELGWCNSQGVFHTDFGSYDVDANEGCGVPAIPAMVEFGMDWGQRRGLFRFVGQGDKRCMRETYDQGWYRKWYETPCTWRIAESEDESEDHPEEIDASAAAAIA